MKTWICVEETVDSAAVLAALQAAGLTAKADTAYEGGGDIILVSPLANCRQVTVGNVTLDKNSATAVLSSGEEIHLTPIEFRMLWYLMIHDDRVVSRDELLPAVWGFPNESQTRVADDTVKRLRRKLSGTTLRIETVWGFGFRATVC